VAELSKFDREFLHSVLTLAAKPDVDHLLYISDFPLDPADLRGRKVKRKLVYAVSDDQIAAAERKRGVAAVVIPPYDYSRVEKVKVALVAGMTAGLLKDGETVLCLTGREGLRALDTLVKIKLGAQGFDEKVSIDSIGLGAEFSSQVVEALVSLALAIGHDGLEGHPIGTIFVLGDSTNVMEKSRQLTLNPFQGYGEAERNALDPPIREAMKQFAVLDGAFIIREDGVVLAAGRYLQPSTQQEDLKLPMGLGARHTAAAAMSVEAKAVAITVSQSTGSVRIFRSGEIVLELHQVTRRT
jgi:DNA integrity scanning protein DisA with diadenylate cyclase activity